MYVKIGPYVNWIGAYQISDKIPFLSEDTKEIIGGWLSETWLKISVNGFILNDIARSKFVLISMILGV